MTEVAVEFQRKTNVASDQHPIDTFQKYSAYGYDAILAISILFHNVAGQLTSSGNISRLNHFSYEDEQFADVINGVLGEGHVSFEGLTVRTVLCCLGHSKRSNLRSDLQGRVEFYNLQSDDVKKREAEGYVVINYYTHTQRGMEKIVLVMNVCTMIV